MEETLRKSGILIHIASLPSKYGIGDLGEEAYRYVDFLSKSEQHLWQLLPLNPTEEVYSNSPYSSISAYAGNILFISPDVLMQEGLLIKEDFNSLPYFPDHVIDYPRVISLKQKFLKIAFERWVPSSILKKEYKSFIENNFHWVNDFALFCIAKRVNGGSLWTQWPVDQRNREAQALASLEKKYERQINEIKFQQFIFFYQWKKFKEYCAKKNVELVGDMPIYVNFDSVDVWKDPDVFQLNDDRSPRWVAGVPPDYFSQTGQKWGNPVYNWDYLKATGYKWWINRFQYTCNMFDHLRVDHFRGFINYWAIPPEDPSAIHGHWELVPHEEFFYSLKTQLPTLSLIAEDLGSIDPPIKKIIDDIGYPGMKILMFAFGEDLEKHIYLPHNYTPNCVVYTGTHDNNTIVGWYKDETNEHMRENVNKYLGHDVNAQTVHWEMINIAFRSVAKWAIIPMQDILGLDSTARMNTPATVENNWQWKMKNDEDLEMISHRLLMITKETGRS